MQGTTCQESQHQGCSLSSRRWRGLLIIAGSALFVLANSAFAQELPTNALARSNARPNLLQRSVLRPTSAVSVQPEYKSHPLWPTLELAVDSYRHLRKNVRDYSCNVIRQERIRGRLRDGELMTAKVRHQRTRNGEVAVPFSVYIKVLAPSRVKGREVLYIDGQNDGEMIVRNGGKRFAFVTASLKPTSAQAMRDNRYPVTDFGLENLVKRLIEVIKHDIRLNVETVVEFIDDAEIDGRPCRGIRVTHPTFDPQLKFHRALVMLDEQLNVPVHYEAYDWPDASADSPPSDVADGEVAAQEPKLLERYTYRAIKLNPGFSQMDFDRQNPEYDLR